VINYRFQGLAEKKPETHQIVLAKLIKLGVRSVKGLCWIYVRKVGFFQGVMSKGCKTQNRSKNYKKG
jgi:hypothetical protein